MSGQAASQNESASTLHCPHCGGVMRVAAEHVQVEVACPHCRRVLQPWRLMAWAGATHAPPYFARQHYWDGYSWRSRWVAGALGILFGPFGVHRFYLGYTGMGILMAVLTVGSVFLLTPIVAIWGTIEGILCFCGAMDDAEGLPLRG